MRNVVVSEFVSLDGVFEEPRWTFAFQSAEQEAFKFAELKAADSLLLGRVTYQGFAAAWPGMAEQTGEFGAMMNGYPKYVASRTLAETEWNASLLNGDLPAAVRSLKEQSGRDILGHGRRLLADGPAASLQLVETKPFSSGVVVLTYRPAAK